MNIIIFIAVSPVKLLFKICKSLHFGLDLWNLNILASSTKALSVLFICPFQWRCVHTCKFDPQLWCASCVLGWNICWCEHTCQAWPPEAYHISLHLYCVWAPPVPAEEQEELLKPVLTEAASSYPCGPGACLLMSPVALHCHSHSMRNQPNI